MKFAATLQYSSPIIIFLKFLCLVRYDQRKKRLNFGNDLGMKKVTFHFKCIFNDFRNPSGEVCS